MDDEFQWFLVFRWGNPIHIILGSLEIHCSRLILIFKNTIKIVPSYNLQHRVSLISQDLIGTLDFHNRLLEFIVEMIKNDFTCYFLVGRLSPSKSISFNSFLFYLSNLFMLDNFIQRVKPIV